MELRPYQKEAKEAIFEQWDSGVLKTLLVLPTGCGKTVVFAKVTEECVRKGDRVLILAHRGELLDQAADKLMKTTGLGCALEKAESSCQGSWFRVVVGSVQTLMREKRLGSFPADYFNTIIIDEAHHCISDSYQRVLQHFPEAQVLGVTATPDRGDMRNLGVYFESLAYEYTLPKAIKEGYLSPIKALTIPLKIDMSSVSVQAGDFKASEIGTALDPYLEGIAQGMQPLVSRFYGKGDTEERNRVLKYALLTMMLLSFGIYLGIFRFAGPIAGVFNSDKNRQLEAIAVEGLRLYFTAAPFAGFNIVISMYFTSVEKAFPAQIISLLRGFLLILPLAFGLAYLAGITGVWLAFPVTEGLTAMGGVFLFRRGRSQ